MDAGMRVLTIVGIAIFCLTHVAYAATGTATFYGRPYLPSTCYGYENNSVMIAAVSPAIWNNTAACGRMYKVRCIDDDPESSCRDQSVVVKIVDYCPSCSGTSFDLSQLAFSAIAHPSAGKINIEYTHLAYAATGTATYYTPPYIPSSCYGYQNNGVMIAAASDAIWNNRAACGRMYRVRCIGPQPCKGESVVVKIVNYCPDCAGTINLSQEAYSVIAYRDDAEIINVRPINIEYTQETLLLVCN